MCTPSDKKYVEELAVWPFAYRLSAAGFRRAAVHSNAPTSALGFFLSTPWPQPQTKSPRPIRHCHTCPCTLNQCKKRQHARRHCQRGQLVQKHSERSS